MKRPKISFVYFDAGGGHRSAALALQAVIESAGYPWDLRLVNLQEVLDPLDVFRKVTRIRLQDLYNLMLAKGWTLGSRYMLPAMQTVVRTYHRPAVRLLQEFWTQQQPDLVVSLVPNLNRAMFEGLQAGLPGTPYATVLTDMADFPPRFWIEKQPQAFICGTERAVEQVRECGHPEAEVFRTSGMILRPAFYAEQGAERARDRERIGLARDKPTGLVLFGGEGSNAMLEIARSLGNSSADLQTIFICGRNTRLRKRLEALRTRNLKFVEGFTKNIPQYMALSDFFIGKPGPGSISEAVQMNLPVIVTCNAWTLPQECYNADWVREKKVGVVLKSFSLLEPTVRHLLESGELDEMRQRTKALENRAVFEIPPILEQLLTRPLSARRGSLTSNL